MTVENSEYFIATNILMDEFQNKYREQATSKLKLQSNNTSDFLIKISLKTYYIIYNT